MVYCGIMTRYEAPKENMYYDAKFIRLGDRLFTTRPNDLDTPHAALAFSDGVLDEMNSTITSDPDTVDAGFYHVCTLQKKNDITVAGNSMGFDLPKTSKARELTITVFQEQSPRCNVEKSDW